MREFLDDDLKRRLADYKEEPDDGLWNKIVANVTSFDTPPGWAVWTPRIAAIVGVVTVASLMFVKGNKRSEEILSDGKKEVELQIQEQTVQQTQKALKGYDGVSVLREDFASRASERDTGDSDQTPMLNEKPNPNTNELKSTIHQDQINTKTFQGDDFTSQNDGVPGSSVLRVGDTNTSFKRVDDVSQDSLFAGQDNGEREIVDKSKEEKSKGHWLRKGSLYLLAMPTFGYNRIEANTNDNIFIESVERIPNFSFKRLGVRLEAGIEYPVSNRLTLTGGVLYYQRNQSIGYSERVVDSIVVATASSVSELSIEPHYKYVQKSFDYNLKNAGMHAGLNYVISKGRFLQSLGTGVEFHKDLSKRSDEEKNFEGGNKPSTFVFYNLYYRLQYPAEGKLKAVFQPMLNYSLYLNKDFQAPFYVKPYGLGVSVGITYKF